MKVSLQWLAELVQADAALLEPESLGERLSLAGFEVEGIDDLTRLAQGVVVGHVEQRDPHPSADRLSVCQVRVGDGALLQIVCGAANVRAGIHVPVALVGTSLPAVALTIKAAELRGVASSGMICSLQELGLAPQSDGIAILEELLPELPPVGSPVGPALGLDDRILDLAITANRPDGYSMIGIAREVAALTGARLTLPEPVAAVEALPLHTDSASAQLIERGGLFSITALSGLRVGPSPLWLQRRLEHAGIRPINNVVDITNLVMLETGQPLHAFDSAALASLGHERLTPDAIGLRPGRTGEALHTLDGEPRALDPETLVVTCQDHPIALAGVMGGAAEAVREDTTAIWLEAAVFPAEAVRRSARRCGLRTEASTRFEKGLPQEVTLAAADRAVALLAELAGGRLDGRWLHQRSFGQRPAVPLRRDALHNLLGPVLVEGEAVDLADERIESTLGALGCVLTATDDGWSVAVPAARALDLRREVDLIEEVARLVGYDRFAVHLPDPLEPGGLTPAQRAERRLRSALCAVGLQETCALSLVAEAPGRLPLANPLLSETSHLRDNLHGELILAARRNIQASAAGFWAFEIGHVVLQGVELAQLTGLVCGERRSEIWSSSGKPQPLAYHEARGVLQAALAALQLAIEDRSLQDHPLVDGEPLLHPGRCADLVLEGRSAGWFGQLHPARSEAWDLPSASFLFELDLQALLSAATRPGRWQPSFKGYATVPASERDLALVVPTNLSSAELLSVMRKAGKPLLEQACLVDRYEAPQLGENLCSQAFRLRYRDSSRTLTDQEVETAHDRIRQALEQRFGARLRS